MPRPNKIWFRKDVGWWMVTVDGKKVRLAKGRENKHKAENEFHKLMIVRHECPSVESPRIADLIERFLKYSKKRDAPDTYRNRKWYCQKFAESCGQYLAAAITPYEVTEWVDRHRWNETTEGNARRTAHRVMSWAVEQGLLRENPLQGMKSPRGRSRQRILSNDEFRAIMSDSHGRFRILIWALRQTGARPSEARRLTWDQVRSDKWVLTTHKTIRKVKSARVVYLNQPMQRLMDYLRKRSNSDHVFLNTRGKPWTANAIRLKMKRIKDKLGLADDVCSYLLRHTFGTRAIMNGCSSSTVAELMGHASTEMIDRVYVHLSDQVEHLQEAIDQATRSPAKRREADRCEKNT